VKRIGIYGGAFNPPHLGHIHAAQYALSALELDALLVIPSHISPGKETQEPVTTPKQRLEMANLAFGKLPGVKVLDLELDRGGVSYTVDTLEQLRKQYPREELILLMGTDMFLSFSTWREPERILQNASIGVFCRGQREEKQAAQQQKAALEEMGCPEADYFMAHMLPCYTKNLDELTRTEEDF
jgi:nicotinate-nucleotide adenylyltransferase